jgi:hypothetical protein
MAILSRFSEHDVRFLAARTQQLALTGHKRSVRSSRALGVLVVVVSFGVVGGRIRHFAIWRACATDLIMTRLFSIL